MSLLKYLGKALLITEAVDKIVDVAKGVVRKIKGEAKPPPQSSTKEDGNPDL